jgi:MoaA/NifB/PqqE/SkfB family radical SAM enzyme
MGFPLRRQYLRIAGRAVRDGRLGWVLRHGLKTLSVPISDRLGRPLAGPIIANLIVTYRCNNTCFMCDLPIPSLYKKRGMEEFGTDGLKRIIDDLAAIGSAGINFSGGEPTLRRDCFELIAYAKQTGMVVNLSSNAFNLAQPDRMEALVATGVDSLNVSLDGARAETNDRLRGVPGCFARVERATELLMEARRNRRPSLTYVFVVGPQNHHEIPEFLALAKSRDVDAVGFMPLIGAYGDHVVPSAEQIAAMSESVRQLRQAKRTTYGDFIDNSDGYLSLFERSWRGEPSPLKCYVTYNHLLVDCYGNLYPCALWFTIGKSSRNIRDISIAEYWRTDRETRRQLSGCRDCYWNCHSEMNLLYQRAPA